MEDNRKGFGGDDKKIRFQRQSKSFKLSQLGSYKTGYTSDDFLIDLAKYFDQEVDFNLDKIRKEIEQPQKLAGLIVKAKEKNTDRKSTRLNSSHTDISRMPSSA